MARTWKWGGKVGCAAIAAVVLGALAPSGAVALVSCSYTGLGLPPPTPANVLTVAMDADGDAATILRSGNAITVKDDNLESIVACSGTAPTVTNTDTISVNATANTGGNSVNIDLAGGPFAPGVINEGNGSSEIEFEAQMPGPESGVIVSGTLGADHIVFGTNGGGAGANLNPDEASPDSDVSLDGADVAAALGGGGDDLLSANGEFGFSAPLQRFAALTGGAGRDMLIGGSGDDFLHGGSDRDRVFGLTGEDFLVGGAGRDRMAGGPGDDLLIARRHGRDRLFCGRGRDLALVDRRDRRRGCEKVTFSGGGEFFL
jgi:Ca2+-binding RTX toxin-like protein